MMDKPLFCLNCNSQDIRLVESADNVFRDVSKYNSLVRVENITIFAYVCFHCERLLAIWTEPPLKSDNEAIERDTLV